MFKSQPRDFNPPPPPVAFRMPQILPYFSVHYSLIIEQFNAM